MKKRMTSLFLALALCLGLLPVTALAAEGDTVYVGGVALTGSSTSIAYAITNESGEVVKDGAYANNYNIKWDGSTLTLRNATIKESVSTDTSTLIAGTAIGMLTESGDAKLTIKLEGTNTIAEVSMGIYVLASSKSTGSASLTITGDGILSASSGSNPGIRVQSNTGNGTLTITGAKVTASSSNGGHGVQIRCGDGLDASLTVNDGSLTATGSGTSGAGIKFQFGSSDYNSGTPSLTVSGNAMVKASGGEGGISTNSSSDIRIEDGNNSSGGIVFDDDKGTVYGKVELQENLTIGEGESLTIPEGASLDTNGKLTVNGGTLNGKPNGNVIYKVTGVNLDQTAISLAVGGTAALNATITPANATNQNLTWSSDKPEVATVDANGKVTAVGAGAATITATATDGSGEKATCTVTVKAPPEPEPEPEPTPPPYIPPTYAVSVPETTGGTVEVSPSRASSGRRVTITTQPAPGYELESLTVLDSRGSEIALTDQGDGKFTFTMPSRKVTVQASFAPVPLPFEDVPPGAWYEEAVRYAYTHGIMEGMSATTFVPNKSLTRAEAVQVLYNLEGQPTVSGTATFPDLVYQWYKPAIAWAESTGVVDGYEDGTFRPDQPVTREEFAQMLYDYGAYKDYDLSAQGDLSSFPDGNQVQEWALPAMSWANGNALINGHDDGTLEPGGTTTRAQAASILMRFNQNVVEE